ncbi:oxidoreductase [Umezawaea sp. NPDC059074]|uniref:oxidoreductase n=1 Tax=Umezawaea sp. NPDC059074 TaxID=3346716 RepID=UPI003685E256
MRTWFITGASRGLGRAIARAALAKGDRVVATARDAASIDLTGPEPDRLLALPLDVTDHASIDRAVLAATEAFGRIDVLVNNAGFGLLGAIEEVTDAEVRRVFETNVFGLLAVTRAVLPVLRRQRAGHVVMISSVGGFSGASGWGAYNATKFAVEGASEALAAEAAPLGVKVTIVEPGGFRTDFLDGGSLLTGERVVEDYAATVGRTRLDAAAAHGNQSGHPDRLADAVVTVVEDPNPPLRLVLGSAALARSQRKLDQAQADFDAWRAVTDAVDEEPVRTTS